MLLFMKLNLLLVCRINCSLDSLRQSDSYPYYTDCSRWFLVPALHTIWFEFINNWYDDSCMKLSLDSKWKDFSKWCGVRLPYFVEYLCLLELLISLKLFMNFKQHKSVHVIAVIYTWTCVLVQPFEKLTCLNGVLHTTLKAYKRLLAKIVRIWQVKYVMTIKSCNTNRWPLLTFIEPPTEITDR